MMIGDGPRPYGMDQQASTMNSMQRPLLMSETTSYDGDTSHIIARQAGQYNNDPNNNQNNNINIVSPERQSQLERLLNARIRNRTQNEHLSGWSVDSEDEDDKNHNEAFVLASKMSDKLPAWFRFSGIPEASGIYLYNIGEGFFITGSVYFSTALLYLGDEVAGCNDLDLDDDEECDLKVWGLLKPTSLATTSAIIVSLCSSLAMPLIGAVIDHTRHRKSVGKYASYCIIAFNAIAISICEETFELMMVLFLLGGFCFAIVSCASNAYLPDFKMNHEEMGRFSASYYTVRFTVMVFCLLFITALSVLFDAGDVGTARIGQIVVVPALLMCWVYAWEFLFMGRPKLHDVPEGDSLLSTGFRSAIRTAVNIHRYFPDLKIFIYSLMLYSAAASSLVAVSSTYMKDQLDMSSIEIGMVFLVVLLFAVPGSILSKHLNSKFNPLNSYRLNIFIWAMTTLIASGVLQGRHNWSLVYLFAAIWGVCYGWKYPTDITIYTTIMPHGSESELIGFKALADGVLVWAPNLCFTLMNEAGVEMHYCLASLVVWFLGALQVSYLMNPYDKVVAHAAAYNDMHEDEQVIVETRRQPST